MKKKIVKRKNKLIKIYAIQCLQCKEIIYSLYRHDFQLCKCDNQCLVDGGFDYCKMGAKNLKKIKHILLKFTKYRFDKEKEKHLYNIK